MVGTVTAEQTEGERIIRQVRELLETVPESDRLRKMAECFAVLFRRLEESFDQTARASWTRCKPQGRDETRRE
jgi:hypothetical protein